MCNLQVASSQASSNLEHALVRVRLAFIVAHRRVDLLTGFDAGGLRAVAALAVFDNLYNRVTRR